MVVEDGDRAARTMFGERGGSERGGDTGADGGRGDAGGVTGRAAVGAASGHPRSRWRDGRTRGGGLAGGVPPLPTARPSSPVLSHALLPTSPVGVVASGPAAWSPRPTRRGGQCSLRGACPVFLPPLPPPCPSVRREGGRTAVVGALPRPARPPARPLRRLCLCEGQGDGGLGGGRAGQALNHNLKNTGRSPCQNPIRACVRGTAYMYVRRGAGRVGLATGPVGPPAGGPTAGRPAAPFSGKGERVEGRGRVGRRRREWEEGGGGNVSSDDRRRGHPARSTARQWRERRW